MKFGSMASLVACPKRRESKRTVVEDAEGKPIRHSNSWTVDTYMIGRREAVDIIEVTVDGKAYHVKGYTGGTSYSDHGHTYTARTRTYEVEVDVLGKPMDVGLVDLMRDHKVLATKWAVEE